MWKEKYGTVPRHYTSSISPITIIRHGLWCMDTSRLAPSSSCATPGVDLSVLSFPTGQSYLSFRSFFLFSPPSLHSPSLLRVQHKVHASVLAGWYSPAYNGIPSARSLLACVPQHFNPYLPPRCAYVPFFDQQTTAHPLSTHMRLLRW